MTTTATALVQTGPREVRFEEIPIPVLEPGEALLRVEANGLCASDIDSWEGKHSAYEPGVSPFPRINGHEIVGVVEDIGGGARGDGVRIGDRVAVNPFLSCGRCEGCREGTTIRCTGFPFRPNAYGYIQTGHAPSLWGGYSTHVYIHPNAILHPFPETTNPLDATLWNPLAAGIEWAVTTPGTTIGTTFAVLGCGQRGLAAVVAAKAAGADVILATGLSRDRHKLDLATEFGADVVVDVEAEDLREAARQATGGRGFDVVLDTSPHATGPLLDALDIVRAGGTVVSAGLKTRPIENFPIDLLTLKNIRLVGCAGSSVRAYQQAASIVASGRFPLSRMRTHVLGFDRLEYGIELLRGDHPEERPINIVITPTMSGT
ncbi:zinc-binding dehydrogenase [Prescottella defluvii]|uniref:zinc-dependent alcohol dehydrogenase n=1 Tax=Prescottella defluvii TaxID=1323361 RepID=UPI0004F39CAD|nr:zinc-binding dehydrogenase [Prescottella defluvii]